VALEILLHNTQTRSRLLEAGQKLFAEQGYAATSMRQVAENAGLAVGGIYNHFLSKEALFQAIILEWNPFRRNNLNLVSEKFDRKQARVLLKELEKHPGFSNLILIELVEFQGKHLPQFFGYLSDGQPPPAAWQTLLTLMVSYHVTHNLLPRALPPDMQEELSMDAFLDTFLKCV